jgi:hypothetical protein
MEHVRCPYRRDDRFLRAQTEQSQPVDRSIDLRQRPRRTSRRPMVERPIISRSLVRRRLTIHESLQQENVTTGGTRPTKDPLGGSPLVASVPFSARCTRPAAPPRARQSRSEEKRRPCGGSTCSCKDIGTTRYGWRLLHGVVMERTAKTMVVGFLRESCWSKKCQVYGDDALYLLKDRPGARASMISHISPWYRVGVAQVRSMLTVQTVWTRSEKKAWSSKCLESASESTEESGRRLSRRADTPQESHFRLLSVRFDDSFDIIVAVAFARESREAKSGRRDNNISELQITHTTMQHLGARDRARKWQRKSVENEQMTINASPFLPKASSPFLLLSCPCRERGML